MDRQLLRYRTLSIPAFILNMINKRYNRLLVCGYAGWHKGGYFVDCICDCGKAVLVTTTNIKLQQIKSCGCYGKSLKRCGRKKHGDAGTRLYSIWGGIKKRCCNQNCSRYHFYGGRGIKMCLGFMDYIKFRDVVGGAPSNKHSIDRIDTNKHYSCGSCSECLENGWGMNCRWATKTEQMNNRRDSVYININGEKMTVTQADRKLGFKKNTIRYRIKVLGWDEEKAISTPVKKIL